MLIILMIFTNTNITTDTNVNTNTDTNSNRRVFVGSDASSFSSIAWHGPEHFTQSRTQT